MPHIQIKLMPKAAPAAPPPMPNPRLQPQDPYVQAKMKQGPGFALKPPPVDPEYLNEIMGNALPKPQELHRPGESMFNKVWAYTSMGIWISAFVIFTVISFILYAWTKQKERNQYWADVNIEFVDLVEEEPSADDGADESSDDDDERVGGGYGDDLIPLKANYASVTSTQASGTTATGTMSDILERKGWRFLPPSGKVTQNFSPGGEGGSTRGGDETTIEDEPHPMFYPRREHYRQNFE